MSLGGGIVSYFAYYFPERVDRLLLLCPAGGTPLSDLKIALKVIRSTLFPTWLLSRILPLVPLLPTPQKGSLGWWQAKYHPGYNYSFAVSMSWPYGSGNVSHSVSHFSRACKMDLSLAPARYSDPSSALLGLVYERSGATRTTLSLWKPASVRMDERVA